MVPSRPVIQILLCAAIASAIRGTCVRAVQPDVVRLGNGIRLVFLPFEGSSDIEIITTVPIGLCSDEKNHAQWSHLIEHLVVTQDGVHSFDEINAETMSDCMHLDYTRPADTWKTGLQTHARWLEAPSFERDAVEREIGRVIDEVNGLAASGRTMKFANGAWAQAIRYGCEHVDMNGDVQRADAGELAAYFGRRFFDGPPPVTVIAGRFDRVQIEQAARELLEPIELSAASKEPPAWIAPENVPTQITWDLPTSHFVVAWRIPDDISLAELAHLHASAAALSQQIAVSAASYIRPGTYVLPEIDLRIAGRRYVLLNLTMQNADQATITQAKEDVRKAAKALATARGPTRAMGRLMTAQQWQQLDDPAAVKQQLAVQGVPRRTIEGNLAVAASLREFEFGRSLPQMIEALEQGNDDAARAALGRVLVDQNRVELLILPAR